MCSLHERSGYSKRMKNLSKLFRFYIPQISSFLCSYSLAQSRTDTHSPAFLAHGRLRLATQAKPSRALPKHLVSVPSRSLPSSFCVGPGVLLVIMGNASSCLFLEDIIMCSRNVSSMC